MKYGKNLQARSVPQWAPYNVDYDALKHLIKTNTQRDSAQAVAIPGHPDTALKKFEEQFFIELSNQHDRVDLFVKSKADEIDRRLQSAQKNLLRLLGRCADNNGKPLSQKRREKFARYDDRIEKCGEEIRLLQRFFKEQRVAFYKILKKYKKWTGSRIAEDRFNYEILNSAKSFTRIDLDPLYSQYSELLSSLRSSTPDTSGPATPQSGGSRRPSTNPHPRIQPKPQIYWNEYDDGSEAESDPYLISIDPNEESTFPGAKAFEYVVSKALAPVEKMKEWFTPGGHSPDERRSLLRNENYLRSPSNFDADVEEDAYASSNDLPGGYVAHYATFPSVNDQRLNRNKEMLLHQACVGSFAASFILLLIAGILVATGRHHYRLEVDAGVLTGVVASLFFAIMGFACMLYRSDNLGWLHRSLVIIPFVLVCVFDVVLLVVVAENTGL
ncbi:hypothetical protein HYALB_00007489 [Hymenoscyphus albidus]|uniref:SPX domain-containing protein n=1 Tax=Hymenoscyphus albidus TaxID=595503 RepID=A0A9N9QCD0_9HELO|nr:hypothetical protein HYALB_00007489 [Hymenoscyphus albidus]